MERMINIVQCSDDFGGANLEDVVNVLRSHCLYGVGGFKDQNGGQVNHTLSDLRLSDLRHICARNSTQRPPIRSTDSFSLPGLLYDPTDLNWRKGTPFEAMTDRSLHRRSSS